MRIISDLKQGRAESFSDLASGSAIRCRATSTSSCKTFSRIASSIGVAEVIVLIDARARILAVVMRRNGIG